MRALVILSLLLSACSTLKKLEPVRSPESVLQRGWSYVEPDADFLAQDAGTSQVSYSGPAVAGSRVVFGSDRFGITVLAKGNGQVLWQKRLEDGVAAQPLVHQSRVYAGTESGRLHAFDLEGGTQAWETRLSAPVEGSLLYSMERLFVATADEALHAVDPATGKVIWTYRRPAFGGTSIRGGHHPAMVAGRIWIGFSDGSLVALDPNDGAVQFEKLFRDNLKFVDVDARVVGWKDGILVATYDGKLRYLRRDGAQIWEFGAGGSRAPIVGDGSVLYFPSSDGNVYALDGDSGKELWRYGFRRGVPTGVAVVGESGKKAIVAAGSDERVVVLDPKTGLQLASVGLGRGSGSYGPIAVDDNNFYVLSSYSRLYQFRLKH